MSEVHIFCNGIPRVCVTYKQELNYSFPFFYTCQKHIDFVTCLHFVSLHVQIFYEACFVFFFQCRQALIKARFSTANIT